MTRPKIVSINNSPAVIDEDFVMRADVTDLNQIIANIDDCNGRNDALRAYIYALRDLARVVGLTQYPDGPTRADLNAAQATVTQTFHRLIFTELSLWPDVDRFFNIGAAELF
jgi:hypothetical protein